MCRVIVQPWHSLHTLTLSHNLLTHLDDSLQLLPVLREVGTSGTVMSKLFSYCEFLVNFVLSIHMRQVHVVQ